MVHKNYQLIKTNIFVSQFLDLEILKMFNFKFLRFTIC